MDWLWIVRILTPSDFSMPYAPLHATFEGGREGLEMVVGPCSSVNGPNMRFSLTSLRQFLTTLSRVRGSTRKCVFVWVCKGSNIVIGFGTLVNDFEG